MLIRLLPELIVDRIAAGEVIERPAAAVKELVENALDAGARRIAVRLVAGGIDLIEVVDDGHGMDAADLALSVQRHATSKLADDNLVRIDTLGFRGEALPSIGAAARLSITSRPAGAAHASRITVAGGAVGEVCPASGATGTTVVVSDLFYATPARRKFLKPPRQEAEHAEAALRRLAMAAPDVAFRLQLEERVVFDLPGQTPAARAGSLLGPDAAAALIPLAAERSGPDHTRHGDIKMALSGFACPALVTRATGASQLLVVNRRPVTDPLLKTAIRVAYREIIARGRHPVVALSITLPPEEVDVNVHPAKTELRFRDAAGVRALVIGGLSRALAAPLEAGHAAVLTRPGLRLVPQRPTWPAPQAQSGPRLSGLTEQQLGFAAGPAARRLEPAAAPALPPALAVNFGRTLARRSALRRSPRDISPRDISPRCISIGGGGRPGARHLCDCGGRRWQPGSGRPACRA